MAAIGFGAYSFSLPRPISMTVVAALMWWVAAAPVRMNIQFRRWRFLVGDTAYLFLTSLALTVIMQGDYILLGLLRDATQVGIYFFAFNLSTQTLTVLSTNLVNVLFPALSQLQGDVIRQTQAYLSAARILAAIGIPLCLLQAALAEPAMRLLVAARWAPSIPVLEVLSIAMSLNLVAGTSYSIFKAQGRFRTLTWLTLAGAVAFLVCVSIAAMLGDALSVAVGVLVFYALFWPVQMYVAIRAGGGGWRDVWQVFCVPVFFGGFAVAVGYAAAKLVPHVPLRDAIRIALITMCSAGIYLLLLRLFARDLLEQVLWLARRR
jgi:PST family polysaccharide transporter